MLLGVSSAPSVKVDLKFLPPKTRNIHVMHLFFAVIHFIDSLDSIDVKLEANHSTLLNAAGLSVSVSAVQLFLSPVLPLGLLGGSCIGLNVIDEGVIRYLSVSLLWCQCDEGEIKRV